MSVLFRFYVDYEKRKFIRLHERLQNSYYLWFQLTNWIVISNYNHSRSIETNINIEVNIESSIKI